MAEETTEDPGGTADATTEGEDVVVGNTPTEATEGAGTTTGTGTTPKHERKAQATGDKGTPKQGVRRKNVWRPAEWKGVQPRLRPEPQLR